MDYVIIDVREPDEYATGHVHGALNLPPAMLLSSPTELENVPKNTPIIVYCRSGNRSKVAMHVLNRLGYDHVINGINRDHVHKRFNV